MTLPISQGQTRSEPTFIRGTIFEVPSKQCPDFHTAIDIAQDGDCIRLEPMSYYITTPVFLMKNLQIFGFNEVGEYAELHMNGDPLKPNMPMLRIDGEKCHIKGVKFRFTHTEEKATVGALQKTYAIFIARGSAVFDDVTIVSSCGGVRNASGTYLSLISCVLECETTGTMIEGRCFFDRCVYNSCGRGIGAEMDACDGVVKVKVEGCCFNSCDEGVSLVGRPLAHIVRNTFVDVGVGIRVYATSLPSAQPSLLRSNEIKNPCRAGIELAGEGCTAEVSRNLIHLIGSPDVSITAAACGVLILEGKPVLKGNVIGGWVGAGIQCLGGDPILESNIVENCCVGVYIHGSRPLIRSNVISGHSFCGIIVELAKVEFNMMLAGFLKSYDFRRNDITPTYSSNVKDEKDESSRDSRCCSPASEHATNATEGYIVPNPSDPYIEDNDFFENNINIRIINMTGMIFNNKLGVSVTDSIVLDGTNNIPIVVVGNVIRGSQQGACVLLSNGVVAIIQGNDMEGSKLAGICMENSGLCEIRENIVKGCQGAVTAMHHSLGTITENKFSADMEVVVFMDSQKTVVVKDNYVL